MVGSSVQAFLMLSQQSANNTQSRLSLVLDRGADDGGGVVPALAASGQPAAGGAVPTAGPAPTGTVGPDEVVSVHGIRVHTSIAENLRALIDAAAADGVPLSGWGWRDNATQIRLRRAHCGTSNWAIYHKPSSQCRPPTARPGASMHEQGKAIDFTYNGRAIGTRSSPAFRWLAANAGRYGFKNLPSEPWHWSTNGR